MKKVFLLAVAGLMITGVSMADTGKKKKKCAKGKSCCSKSTEESTAKEKSKTAKL
ncbi:MAG: hypothetical protein V4725_02905 [Bacteroidota bacterium]|nr:hypothetical protein [Ferruginibacter sp.]